MSQFSNPPPNTPNPHYIPTTSEPVAKHGIIYHPLPPKVAAAIVEVMAAVPHLARDEVNVHGKYKFAGIDAFLDAVRPLCAKAGLVILQDEVHSDMTEGVDRQGNPKRWLHVSYVFILSHASGETWEHRPLRSVVIDASMGSQAFGAAQSYCLKLFLRSLFQISTGEQQDVDNQPPNPLPGKPSKEEKKQAFIDSCRTLIAGATDAEKLVQWWNHDSEKALRRLHELTQPEVQALMQAVTARRAGIEALAQGGRSAPERPQPAPGSAGADDLSAPTAGDDADPEAEAQDIIKRLDSLHDEETIKNLMEDYKVWERLEVGVFNRQHAQAIETAFRAAIERATTPDDDGPPPPPMG